MHGGSDGGELAPTHPILDHFCPTTGLCEGLDSFAELNPQPATLIYLPDFDFIQMYRAIIAARLVGRYTSATSKSNTRKALFEMRMDRIQLETKRRIMKA